MWLIVVFGRKSGSDDAMPGGCDQPLVRQAPQMVMQTQGDVGIGSSAAVCNRDPGDRAPREALARTTEQRGIASRHQEREREGNQVAD